MPTTLLNLILDVQNLERSLAFYVDLLRLQIDKTEDLDGHRLAYLSTGGTELLLIQQPIGDQLSAGERTAGVVLNFRVRDLKGIANRLKKGEVQVLRPLEEPSLGEKSFLVTDPDGYAVLLSEPLETVH